MITPNTVTGIIIFFMAVALGASGIFFYYPYWQKLQQLDAVISVINKYKGTQVSSSNTFQAFSNDMKGNALVGKMWNTYEKTLIHIEKEEDTSLYSTEDSELYFTSESLAPDINIGYWKNLPGVFTGLGILGTFIGLTIGLGGINTTSTSELQKGIVILLGGMTSAFATSIAGIIIALAYGVIYSQIISRFDIKVNYLTETFDSFFPRKRSEQILADSLKEIREQTSEIKMMGTDIAEEFSKSIDQAPVFSKLENAIAQMSSSLDHLNGSIDKLNTSGVNEIAGSLDKNIGKQLKDFADTLTNLQIEMEGTFEKSTAANQQSVDALRKVIEEMKSSNKDFNASLKDMMQQISNMNKDLTANSQSTIGSAVDNVQNVMSDMTNQTDKQMKSITAAMESMKNSIDEMLQKINSQMGQHEESITTIMNALKEAAVTNRTILNEAGNTVNQFKEASLPMQKVADHLDASVNNMVRANQDFKTSINQNIQALKNISDSNQNASADMRTALQNIEKSWHAYESNFQQVGENLGKTFEILRSGIASYNKSTSQALIDNLNRFDRSISTAMSQIAGCNDELQEAANIIADSIRRKSR